MATSERDGYSYPFSKQLDGVFSAGASETDASWESHWSRAS